jgi:hypothetical protein
LARAWASRAEADRGRRAEGAAAAAARALARDASFESGPSLTAAAVAASPRRVVTGMGSDGGGKNSRAHGTNRLPPRVGRRATAVQVADGAGARS